MHDQPTLNPGLYSALKQVFKHVCISNQGMAADYSVEQDFWGKKTVVIRHWGETYSVSCPYCGDRRTRLYLSHIWGTQDPRIPYRLTDFIVCHNEGCNMRGFWNLLYSGDTMLGLPEVVEPEQQIQPHRMEFPCPEKDLIPLERLPSDHKAVRHIRDRGLDPVEMSRLYGLCYCPYSDWAREIVDSTGKTHLLTPADRIIIPNIQSGAWYGWQARYIGDLPTDPKTGKKLLQKYLSAPGYPIGHTVYNLDMVVANTAGKLCFVNEGPISAMACKGYGVAIMGMYPKPMQEELLAQKFEHGQIFFLVEAEAVDNSRLKGIVERLGRRVAGGCKMIHLEPGIDAVNLGFDQVVSLAEQV